VRYDFDVIVVAAHLALDAWRELESRAGERLLLTTGGVDAGQASLACAEAMRAAGVRFEPAGAIPVDRATLGVVD
jgi:hypothetical protein